MSEMAALKVDTTLFLCYSEESTTAFKVTFDTVLWNEVYAEAKQLYQTENPKKPVKTSEFAKSMKSKLQKFTKTNVEFLGEFPSSKKEHNDRASEQSLVLNSHLIGGENPYCYSISTQSLVNLAKSCFEVAHQLQRRRATEVLVWLILNTDRLWDAERPQAIPVAYALKGYSLTCAQMRSMCDDVLKFCTEKEMNIVCMAFDGQWLKLIVRDADGKPLTLLQLQRDVYDDACKATKMKQIHGIKEFSSSKNVLFYEEANRNDKARMKHIICVSCINFSQIVQKINWKRLSTLI